MKMAFLEIKDLNILSIRRKYAHDCRNFQFDVPCSLKVISYGMDGITAHTAVEKALEGIAWVKGCLKEQQIINKGSEESYVEVIIEELKDEDN